MADGRARRVWFGAAALGVGLALAVGVAPRARSQETDDGPIDPDAVVASVGRYAVDNVWATRTDPATGASASTWMKTDPGLSRVAAQGTFAGDGSDTPDPQVLFPQTRGRFVDAAFDRVLALRSFTNNTGRTYRLSAPPVSAPGQRALPIPSVDLDRGRITKRRATALAAGDLDGVSDADGFYHDEAVIAFETDDHQLAVQVVDYNADPAKAVVTSGPTGIATVGPKRAVDRASSLAAGVGDFDRDGRNEVAVVFVTQSAVGGPSTPAVAMFQYGQVGDERGLTLVQPPITLPVGESSAATRSVVADLPSLDLTVGDFDGANYPEIALSHYVGADGLTARLSVIRFAPAAAPASSPHFVVSAVGISDLQAHTSLADPGQDWITKAAYPTDYRPRVVSGLFGAVGPGALLGRHQLALAWPAPSANQPGLEATAPHATSVLEVFGVSSQPAQLCGRADKAPCTLGLRAAPSARPAPIGPPDVTAPGAPPPAPPDAYPIVSLTAGGYRDVVGATITQWGITAGVYVGPHPGAEAASPAPFPGKVSQLSWFSPSGLAPGLVVSNLSGGAFATNLGEGAFNLIAFDQEGKSLFLGPPSRFSVDDLAHVDVLAQEPPKHLDWDAAEGTWTRVSRSPEYFVRLASKEGKASSSTTTNTGDYTVGGSVEVGAKASVEAGSKLVGEDAEAELEGKLKLGGAFSRGKEQSAAAKSSYAVTSTNSTTDDDFITGTTREVDVYRYPIYGRGTVKATTGEDASPFFEVVHENPASRVQFSGSGRAIDSGYQPLWENGNALSYPDLVEGRPPMPDAGSYTVDVPTPADPTCSGVGVAGVNRTPVTADPTVPPALTTLYTVDQNQGETELSYEAEAAKGCELSSTGKLTTEAGFKATLAGQVSEGAEQEKARVWVDVNFESENTWSKLNVAEVTASKGFEYAVVHDGALRDARFPYSVASAYYLTTAGTQRVTHGVRFPIDPNARNDAWSKTYGRTDPALNLPDKILMEQNPNTDELTEPIWNSSAERQKIRGFFVLHPEDTPVAAERGAEFGRNPVAGEKVALRVRVSNYSVSQPASNVKVRFDAVEVENSDGEEGPTKLTGLQVPIGSTDVDVIPPRGVAEATVPWDTTGHGPEDGSGSRSWLVFVTVDPDNTIPNETHELHDRYSNPATVDGRELIDPRTGRAETLEAGQNNQGWGALTIAAKAGSSTSAGAAVERPMAAITPFGGLNRSQRAAAATVAGDGRVREPAVDVSTHDASLSAGVPGRARHSSNAVAELHRPAIVSIHLRSSDSTTAHHRALVYDGDPDRGGELISSVIVAGIDKKEGGRAWFTWVPRTVGAHHLVVRVVELHQDPKRGNAEDDLVVNVAPTGHLPAERASARSGTTVAALGAAVVVLGLLVFAMARRRRGTT
ncbi:MAG: hypothetical protein QOE35_3231 [Actinomycetota bacterium]|jgi:hypothetical protein